MNPNQNATAPLQSLQNKHVSTCWCPTNKTPLLAMASNGKAGVGADFSAPENKLEIAKFDIGTGSSDLQVIGGITIPSAVNACSWNSAAEPGGDTLGMLATGNMDGIVQVWNPTTVAASRTDGALLLNLPSPDHISDTAPCTAVQFHPDRPGLLVSGFSNGQALIYNIENGNCSPFEPGEPGKVRNAHSNTAVSAASWNHKVAHIVSTCSSAGNVCIWDLRQKKMATAFKDNARQNANLSCGVWHPNEATQLAVGYNDDHNPAIQFWDLRKHTCPYLEMKGHMSGIQSLSWSSADHRLLLSSGRDNLTRCWYLPGGSQTPQALSDIMGASGDVRWCPKSAGVFLSANQESVGVYSMMTQQNSEVKGFVPKWCEKKCGGNFGFGGKIATWGVKQSTAVSVHLVPNEPDIVAGAQHFEQWLANGDLGSFAKHMAGSSEDGHEKKTWELMGMLFDPDHPNQIVGKMGFERDAVLKAAESYLGQAPGTMLGGEKKQEEAPAPALPPQEPSLDADQAENFFENLAVDHEKQEREEAERRASLAAAEAEVATQGTASDWNRGPELLIKESLLIGDLPCAVEVCLKAGRMADALLLASGGDAELFNRTKEEYMKRSEDTFLKTVGCIMTGDLDAMVANSDLDRWQETLAIIATYAKADRARYGNLCVALGERLRTEKHDVRSAVFCNLAAANFSGTVEIWNQMSATNTQTDALESIVQKMAVLQAATQFRGSDKQFTDKVTAYAEVLANSGCLTSAMRYLSLITESDEKSDRLKDRIFNAVGPQVMQQMQVRQPNFPFDRVNVQAQVIQQAPAHYGGKGGHMQQQQQGGYGARPGQFQQQQQQQRPGMQAASGYGGQQQQQQNPNAYGQPTAQQNGRSPYNANPQAAVNNFRGGAAQQQPAAQQRAAFQQQPAAQTGFHQPSPAANGYHQQQAQQPYQAQQQPAYGAQAQQQPQQAGGYQQQGYQQQGAPGYQQPAAAQNAYQSAPANNIAGARPGAGPGHSSAPSASASSSLQTSSLTSWPLPTKAQQSQYVNPHTVAGNAAVHSGQQAAPLTPMDPTSVGNVKQSFDNLINLLGQSGMRPQEVQRYQKAVGVMVQKLTDGNVAEAKHDSINKMCEALNQNNMYAVNQIMQGFTSDSTFWSGNKDWLMPVKSLFTHVSRTNQMQQQQQMGMGR